MILDESASRGRDLAQLHHRDESAAELPHGVLADRMVGGDEGAEVQTWNDRISWVVMMGDDAPPPTPTLPSLTRRRHAIPDQPSRDRYWATKSVPTCSMYACVIRLVTCPRTRPSPITCAFTERTGQTHRLVPVMN